MDFRCSPTRPSSRRVRRIRLSSIPGRSSRQVRRISLSSMGRSSRQVRRIRLSSIPGPSSRRISPIHPSNTRPRDSHLSSDLLLQLAKI